MGEREPCQPRNWYQVHPKELIKLPQFTRAKECYCRPLRASNIMCSTVLITTHCTNPNGCSYDTNQTGYGILNYWSIYVFYYIAINIAALLKQGLWTLEHRWHEPSAPQAGAWFRLVRRPPTSSQHVRCFLLLAAYWLVDMDPVDWLWQAINVHSSIKTGRSRTCHFVP